MLTFNVLCISESCIEIKIMLNFYFHTSLWCLKRFYEGLKGLKEFLFVGDWDGKGYGKLKLQRSIQGSYKHLRQSNLQKQLTTFNLLNSSPSQVFVEVLDTSMNVKFLKINVEARKNRRIVSRCKFILNSESFLTLSCRFV